MNTIPAPKREAHLKDYFRILRKHVWLTVATAVIATAGGAAWINTQPSIFQASAAILIDPEPPKFINLPEITSVGGADYFQTQYEIIRSRAVMERVLQTLNLPQRSPEFAHGGDVVGQVQAAVSVEPKRGTRIVYVKFEHTDPAVAAEVANAVANAYIRYNLDLKLRGTQDALGWLTEQIGQLKTRMQDSSTALQSYRTKSGIMGLQEQRQITAQKIMDFNKQYLEAQAQRLTAEAKLNSLTQISKDRTSAESMFTVVQSPIMEKLKNEISELELQRSKLLKVYRDKHPEIVKLDAQIQHITQRVDAEIQNMVRSLQTEYRVAKAREENLLSNVNQLKREGQDLNEKEMQYLTLQRDVESNQQLYETVLKRMKETGMAGGLETNNVRIMEEAKAPGAPIRPRKVRTVSGAALTGLLIGLGLAIAVEYFDTTVKSTDDVERYLGLPVIATVPVFSLKK